ncbi:hypothetical protein OAK16_03025 [Verrucomicrobia bacterium]|nr:hypothetical protein [Verrucomicrobiota bacterium]
MNIRNILITLCLLAVFPLTVSAKVLTVLPGKSIQEKIDEAEDNDFVAIFGGTYNENLTIDNKVIRLVEVKGQEVTIAGNITFKNCSVLPPFEGFEFSAGELKFENNQGDLVLRNIDHENASNIQITGSDNILIDSCKFREIYFSGSGTATLTDVKGGHFEIRNGFDGKANVSNSEITKVVQISGSLNIVNTTLQNFTSGSGSEKTILFRCVIGESKSESYYRTQRLWMGYCTVYSVRSWFMDVGADSKHVIVGCEFNGNKDQATPICFDRFNNSSFSIINSKIHNVGQNNDHIWADNCIEVRGSDNSKFLIQNNYLQTSWIDSGVYGTVEFRVNESNEIIFRNNVCICRERIGSFPFGSVIEGNQSFTVSDQLLVDGQATIGKNNVGHAVSLEEIRSPYPEEGKLVPVAAALYKDHNVYEVSEGSVLIDAGVDNPLYNDRDGTRNDAGPSGGVWYDPDGWTTEKPVVISFEVSSDLVLQGADTEVIISEGQAVSAPAASE